MPHCWSTFDVGERRVVVERAQARRVDEDEFAWADLELLLHIQQVLGRRREIVECLRTCVFSIGYS